MARTAGSRLFKNVMVRKYLAERIKELQKITHITQENIVRQMGQIAFSNIADYLEFSNKGVKFKNSAYQRFFSAKLAQNIFVEFARDR